MRFHRNKQTSSSGPGFYVLFVSLALVICSNAESISDCEAACFENAVRQTTRCSPDELSCFCNNIDSVLSVAKECILTTCDSDGAYEEVLHALRKPASTTPRP
ncbi:MAG: hypothetical protein J3R72DRAFT_392157 [Linnemannia gamsii]|nr:MAG: hypothetical protein J3R72DRAFT_392157 [Linnemannia gamsii]